MNEYDNTTEPNLEDFLNDLDMSEGGGIFNSNGDMHLGLEGDSEVGQLVINSYEMVSDFWGGE